MTEKQHQTRCPSCGVMLPATAPSGLCPRCLVQEAMVGTNISELPVHDSQPTEPRPAAAGTELPAPGTALRYLGDYEILEEIARGAMGVVYKARQTSLDRIVAIKMILAGELADAESIQRFRAEAEAAARLHHPHIVSVHEVGEYAGHHYFCMDYVAGQNLKKKMLDGPLAPLKATEYVTAIAVALQSAHEQGVLHRDLKPANIMIDQSDQPRITDFGLAKIIGQDSGLTHTGAVMGSPSYMAPEQAEGRLHAVGPASDVYALGAILYELLTGRAPFQGPSLANTINQVVHQPPIAPRSLNPQIPVDLETICLKCLEKHSAGRYASAAELADDLQRFANRQPISARTASWPIRAWSVAKNRPWLITTLTILCCSLLLAVTYGLWQHSRFLNWQFTHPDSVRQPGPRTERLETWRDNVIFVFLAISTMALIGQGDPRQDQRTARVYSRGLLFFTAGCGLAGFGLSVVFLTCIIDAWVWESSFRVWDPLWFYFGCYFSYVLIWMVAQEFEKRVFGVRGDQDQSAVDPDALLANLGDEQQQAISDALLANQEDAAMKYCGERLALNVGETLALLNMMQTRLHKQHPDRIDPPPPPPTYRYSPRKHVFQLAILVGLVLLAVPAHVLCILAIDTHPAGVAGIAGAVASILTLLLASHLEWQPRARCLAVLGLLLGAGGLLLVQSVPSAVLSWTGWTTGIVVGVGYCVLVPKFRNRTPPVVDITDGKHSDRRSIRPGKDRLSASNLESDS